jgi:putative hydrolase of the HAD superfamily
MRRLLLLDAMGTLVRLRPPAPVLRRAVGVTLAEAEAAFAAEIRFYRAHMHEGRDDASVARLRDACARVLWDHLPLARVEQTRMTETLLRCLHFDPYPDAAPAITAARARGERVIVVSNWDRSLHDVLERAGLAVDAVITSAEAGVAKPDPAIFRLALADVDPSLALHVGDSVEEDVAGARAAGLPVALLRRGGAPSPVGVRTVTSLAEI